MKSLTTVSVKNFCGGGSATVNICDVYNSAKERGHSFSAKICPPLKAIEKCIFSVYIETDTDCYMYDGKLETLRAKLVTLGIPKSRLPMSLWVMRYHMECGVREIR